MKTDKQIWEEVLKEEEMIEKIPTFMKTPIHNAVKKAIKITKRECQKREADRKLEEYGRRRSLF